MKGKGWRGALRAGFVILLLSFITSCGMQTGGGSDQSASGDTSRLTFVWPDGYSFNPATGEIFAPSNRLEAPLPAYVTRITLTITGTGLDTPMVLNVPLDLLSVNYALPPGPKIFTVTVYTNIGLTFTDSVEADLVAGLKIDLQFEMVVNAPPVIERIDAAATTIFKNSPVSVTAVATDADNDTLSYSWSGGGGTIAGSGASVTFAASKKGNYTLCVTITDGSDGSATGCVTISVQNRLPVINSVTASSTTVTKGKAVSLTCAATDADNDTLSYSWSGSDGFSATGATVSASPTAQTTYTCTVTDGDGGQASGSVSVKVKALTVTLADSIKSSSAGGSGDEWSVTIPAAATVTITCSQTSVVSHQLNFQLWVEQGSCLNGSTQATSGRGGAGASVSVTVTYSNPATLAFWLDSISGVGTNLEAYQCVITPSTTITGTTQTINDAPLGC